MKNDPPFKRGHQLWWAVLAGSVVLVMVLKRWGLLAFDGWRWVALGGGAVLLWRLWGLLRTSSSSLGRTLLWFSGLVMAGFAGVAGLPVHRWRGPAWSEVVGVVTPLLIGLGTLVILLVGMAGLHRRRERDGGPSRPYLPILLSLVILAVVWQVVRQPLWKESMEGMLTLPLLGTQRRALEKGLVPTKEPIEAGKPSTPARASASVADEPVPTAAGRPGQTGATLPLGKPDRLADSAPANAEQWIQAAIHNPDDPQLELRASIALVAEGRDDLAIRRLGAARKRGCHSPDLLRFHARLLLTKNRPAAAASVLEDLVASPQGTDQDLHETLKAWQQAGQGERAESLAERVLVKRPSRDLFRWLADRDASQGRYERALALLSQLSRRSPFDPADAFQLAEVALRAGRPELALDAVSRLEQAGHRSPRTIRLAQQARDSALAGPPHSSRTSSRPRGG